MRDGSKIDIDDMSKEHLRNVLKMLIRNTKIKFDHQNTAFHVTDNERPSFKTIEEEVLDENLRDID